MFQDRDRNKFGIFNLRWTNCLARVMAALTDAHRNKNSCFELRELSGHVGWWNSWTVGD